MQFSQLKICKAALGVKKSRLLTIEPTLTNISRLMEEDGEASQLQEFVKDDGCGGFLAVAPNESPPRRLPADLTPRAALQGDWVYPKGPHTRTIFKLSAMVQRLYCTGEDFYISGAPGWGISCTPAYKCFKGGHLAAAGARKLRRQKKKKQQKTWLQKSAV